MSAPCFIQQTRMQHPQRVSELERQLQVSHTSPGAALRWTVAVPFWEGVTEKHGRLGPSPPELLVGGGAALLSSSLCL